MNRVCRVKRVVNGSMNQTNLQYQQVQQAVLEFMFMEGMGNVRFPLWLAAVGPRSDRVVVAVSAITST